jgi:hypothetical protein
VLSLLHKRFLTSSLWPPMPPISARPVPEKTMFGPNALNSLPIRVLLRNLRQGNLKSAVMDPAKNLANRPVNSEEFFEIARKIED